MALGYAWDSPLPPTILASGAGTIAGRILAAARESGVAVQHDQALAEALASVGIGSHVPQELWTAVATVLAFLYRADAEAAQERP